MKLMRFKAEEAFKKPHLVLFYDVMSEYEMDVIKYLASGRLQRAPSERGVTYRTSKSGWVTDFDHEVSNRVSYRFQELTGLTKLSAEYLQAVNYGIGGHYAPHYDWSVEGFPELGTGNRIATFLNYMSDVEAGGATVFPALGVTVWPKKGSAVFWYNLHKSGDRDYLTKHAACPVLVGSKWIVTKWFHEYGQEFRRPCGLKVYD
jgi:prolyl 4-hydroxylase